MKMLLRLYHTAVLLFLALSAFCCVLPEAPAQWTVAEAAQELTPAWGPVLTTVAIRGSLALLHCIRPESDREEGPLAAVRWVFPAAWLGALVLWPARIAVHLVCLSLWLGLLQPPVMIVVSRCRSAMTLTCQEGRLSSVLQCLGPRLVLALTVTVSLLWLVLPVGSLRYTPALAGVWSLVCQALRSGVWNAVQTQ